MRNDEADKCEMCLAWPEVCGNNFSSNSCATAFLASLYRMLEKLEVYGARALYAYMKVMSQVVIARGRKYRRVCR